MSSDLPNRGAADGIFAQDWASFSTSVSRLEALNHMDRACWGKQERSQHAQHVMGNAQRSSWAAEDASAMIDVLLFNKQK